ncbi:MAG: TetR/AcrR family transcriptional regulator [Phenylobacterium sp.]|uniref:TetR/AcrR family transcriptional regulator n=1 Tax=Phenylobacterium sp. TaxID=1871053 RepID=UPI00391CB38F
MGMTTASPPAHDSRRPSSLSRRELYDRVWARPLAEVAADMGLSRTGLAKMCERLQVPCPPRGYWARRRRGEAGPPPALTTPPGPAAPGRRRRLEGDERRAQLMDAAAALIGREGIHAATLKRVARDCGVSEALAQAYFGRQADLLVALARRELETVRSAQESEIAAAHGPAERLARSTSAYLRQVERRGALLQLLLGNPAVREGLRAERALEREARGGAVAERFADASGVAPDLARSATTVLTGLCLRAGRLLARGRLDLDTAEALSIAMVRHGNRRLAALSDPALGGQGREAS